MARVPFSRSRSRRGKDLRDEAHVHVAQERRIRPARGDDARAFLPAMLQGEETVVGQDGGVRMAENGENAALVGRFVVLHSGRASGRVAGALGPVKRRLNIRPYSLRMKNFSLSGASLAEGFFR